MKKAYLFDTLEDSKVQCRLCSHRCVIKEGSRGICMVRQNNRGQLYSLVYGKLVAERPDPIEKKPLFHFLPSSYSYSIATAGCNFKCKHCQNADISQMARDKGIIMGSDRTPEDVVKGAVNTGCASISYTYTEPTVYFEFAYDTSLIAVEHGLKNVFVTNGYMTKDTLDFIYPNLHAANVDLKAFTERFYKDICGARLEPVLKAIEGMKAQGIWVEVTTLLIPGLNDDEKELKDLIAFLISVDPDMPWHVTRFHPDYRLLDRPATPVSSLKRTREMALDMGLRFVYTGNVLGEPGEDTYCPSCGELLIKRYGFYVEKNLLKDGRCFSCKATIPGIWA